MKYLSENQVRELSYQERRKYYQQVKDFKFANVKEGTPLVYYSLSGKIIVFKYRKTGVDIPGSSDQSEYVYGNNSSVAYSPTEVEIATLEDIEEYIEQKKLEFNKILKYYEDMKELVNAN